MNKILKNGVKLTLVLAFCFALLAGMRAEAALTIGATSVTSDGAVTINGVATSTYAIGAATTSGTITIGGTAQTGAIAIGDTASSTVSEISIGGGNGVKTINIGDGTGANTINIGTGGTGADVITIGSTAAGLRYYESIDETAGDITLTAADSGRTIYMGTAGKDATLPLASAASGVWYKFIVSANVATTDMTITGPAADATDDTIYGSVTVNGAAVACSAEDTLTLVADTNEAIPGDWVELHSDGTNWYISGQVVAASAFTCTDAD